MEKLPQISEAEYEIMKIVWAESPISTNSICEKIAPYTIGVTKLFIHYYPVYFQSMLFPMNKEDVCTIIFPLFLKTNIYHKKTICFCLDTMMVKCPHYFLLYSQILNYLTKI